MDVSICILTHHQPELLESCVAACFREIESAALRAEVFIIDNASFDGSPQHVARRFPAVQVLRNEQNMAFSAGNNRAIRYAHGRLVLVLNDDAILGEGSLKAMVDALLSDSRIAVVGPRLLNPDGSLQRGFTNRRFPRLRSLACSLLGLSRVLERNGWTRDLLTHSRDPELRGETDHIAGACLLVRRAALDRVGLFDEGFHYWFEDADLCFRLKREGWKIFYLPEVRVVHYGSASVKKLMQSSERRLIYFRSLAYFSKKHLKSVRYLPLRSSVAMLLSFQVFLNLVSLVSPKVRRDEKGRDALGRSVRDLRWFLLGDP